MGTKCSKDFKTKNGSDKHSRDFAVFNNFTNDDSRGVTVRVVTLKVSGSNPGSEKIPPLYSFIIMFIRCHCLVI